MEERLDGRVHVRYSVSVLDLMTDSMAISYASVNREMVRFLAKKFIKAEKKYTKSFLADVDAGKGGRLVSAEGLEQRYILSVDPD